VSFVETTHTPTPDSNVTESRGGPSQQRRGSRDLAQESALLSLSTSSTSWSLEMKVVLGMTRGSDSPLSAKDGRGYSLAGGGGGFDRRTTPSSYTRKQSAITSSKESCVTSAPANVDDSPSPPRQVRVSPPPLSSLPPSPVPPRPPRLLLPSLALALPLRVVVGSSTSPSCTAEGPVQAATGESAGAVPFVASAPVAARAAAAAAACCWCCRWL
jgi:hypothetical protein